MTARKSHHYSRDRAHARIYAAWRKLPAWFTLDTRGQALVVAVRQAYRPDGGPNAFALPDSMVADLLGCSENIARRTVHNVIERGWFVLERGGGFRGKKGARARVVSLADYETLSRPAQPERFEKWRPPAEISNGAKSAVCVVPLNIEWRKR